MAGRKQEARDEEEHRHTIGGILLLALSIYIIFAAVSSSTSPGWTGILGVYGIKWLLEKIAGMGLFMLPILLAFMGTIMLSRQQSRSLRIRLSGFVIFFITFVTTAQIFFPVYYLDAPHLVFKGGGGILGYVFYFIFSKLLGSMGSYILLSTLFLISIILVFNITTLAAFAGFIKWIMPERREKPKTKEKKSYMPQAAVIEDDREDDKSSIAAQLPLIKDMPKDKIEEKEEIHVPESFEIKDHGAFENKISEEDLFKEPAAKKKYVRYSYKLPALDMLRTLTDKEKQKAKKLNELTLQRKAELERVLKDFGVGAHVVNTCIGPAVTRFEVQPDPGVKVSKIANLADDIALNLASGGVRIEAPVLGKAVVGIEVPNAAVTPVHLGEIARTKEFAESSSKMLIGIGKDLAGTPIFGDLSKMPHILIAGTTGSGKSVAINSLITSILLRARPDEVKFIMIDPKMVELAAYEDIPHLMAPVVTDTKKAAATLKTWVIGEMERRYKDFFHLGVRNIEAFNKKAEAMAGKEQDGEFVPEKLPYLVVIIDELADLMLVAAAEVETSICRIAQMARATGIHLVLATQRPSVDVITGLIKANIPSRISFAVATQIDSRVVLDVSGAEKLLGRGDMLYSPIGAMKPTRVQGAYVSDEEIEKIVAFVKSQASPEYSEEIINLKYIDDKTAKAGNSQERDELFGEAARILIESGQASTSHLQRRMRIGYNRAARLMDELTEAGVVSPPDGENKARKIMMGISEMAAMGLIDTESQPDYPKF